jgi:hypothetical protein
MKALGAVLIALGVIGLVWGGITWTKRDKVLDVGPVQVTKEEHKSLPIPPIAGAVCLVAGVALMFVDGRRRSA